MIFGLTFCYYWNNNANNVFVDDIPIQAGQVAAPESAELLTSITEEGESDAPLQRGAGARASKPKISAFPVLGKKTKDSKDKDKAAPDKKVTVKDTTKVCLAIFLCQ